VKWRIASKLPRYAPGSANLLRVFRSKTLEFRITDEQAARDLGRDRLLLYFSPIIWSSSWPAELQKKYMASRLHEWDRAVVPEGTYAALN
jgi:hypothetical protein